MQFAPIQTTNEIIKLDREEETKTTDRRRKMKTTPKNP